MNNLLPVENAVASIRISSVKQGLMGDSPEAQKEQIERFAQIHNINIKKFFIFIESGAKEKQPVQEAIDYCKNPKNDIQLFIVKSIDRFTRGGSYLYDHLKMQLTRYGVKLVDIYGIINTQEINTLDHLGLKYSWSMYFPTQKSEILEAERAKDERRDILTRMIGAEARYVRLGYRVGVAPFGYVNTRIESSHGRRLVLKPHSQESKLILRMFELRIRGTMTDYQIIDEINKIGYVSRKHYLRSPQNKTQAIGVRGGQKLNVKQFWNFIQNPVYAGITVHKWTDYKPIKSHSDGLITIDEFNKANRGKIAFAEENGQIKIYKDNKNKSLLKKTVKNPNFPYKRYVFCPICNRPFYGSASRGRSGKHYPAYHCNKRGHHYRVSKKIFEDTVHSFVKDLRFSPEYTDKLKEITLNLWKSRQSEQIDDNSQIKSRILELRAMTKAITEKIKFLTSETAILGMDKELIAIEQEIKVLERALPKSDSNKVNNEAIVKKIDSLIQNPEDLFLGSSDPFTKAAHFSMIFSKTPTYQELLTKTARLIPLLSYSR